MDNQPANLDDTIAILYPVTLQAITVTRLEHSRERRLIPTKMMKCVHSQPTDAMRELQANFALALPSHARRSGERTCDLSKITLEV